jgi:hypothetical protein
MAITCCILVSKYSLGKLFVSNLDLARHSRSNARASPLVYTKDENLLRIKLLYTMSREQCFAQ